MRGLRDRRQRCQAWISRQAFDGGSGQPRRLALVQVQRGQHDTQQFWLALLDAIRHASATVGRAEPPAATPDFNAPAMAGRVLSELADARGGVTLVVDDLHELTSPEALAQLTRLLVNLPPHVHVSRPEIAGKLSVLPNTVSAHIRSIYAKLQVGDRSSAVRRARELRLLAARRTR